MSLMSGYTGMSTNHADVLIDGVCYVLFETAMTFEDAMDSCDGVLDGVQVN